MVVNPLIPELLRQRQVDLCEFKASLVLRTSFRTGKAIYRETVCRQTEVVQGSVIWSWVLGHFYYLIR